MYLRQVDVLNNMKDFLRENHTTMTDRVKKKFVVHIQRMEQNIHFYENKWALFKNEHFDYKNDLKFSLSPAESVRKED